MQVVLEPAEGITKGGVLHVQGPNLMAGYLRYETPGFIEPPSSSKGIGWYSTGDIVSIDNEGFLAIQGRLKRFAKIGGEMIPLEAVEKLVGLADDQHAHAVVSRPDEAKGEQLVVFTTSKELTRAQLVQAGKAGGFPELYVPRKIVVLEKLPLLGALKIDYVTLTKLAAAA
jgi:acyl-[acyl-carrier-protein]-phospholipid O-acyltransferase/long-chain-fatty-acid--[acyl-carrier-protein] ligase